MKNSRFQRISLLLLLCVVTAALWAKDALVDYDRLRSLSSERLMEQGRRCYREHKAAEALACFTLVGERQAESLEERQLKARALNNSACVYKFFYFNYTKAYEHFIQAYELCEETGDDDFLPVIMVNLGDLLNDYSLNYNSKPLAQQAQELFDKGIDRAKATKHWELLTTAFFNLANQNYDLDLRKYDILFSKEIPDSTPDLQYARLQYRAIEHMQRKEYDAARRCFEQQLAAVSTLWAPERDTLATLMSIATTYRLERKNAHSIDYLTRALRLTEEKDISDLAATLCRQLSELYHEAGNEQQAGRYHLLYMEMMERTHGSQLSHIAELNYINELKKREAHTQELERVQYLQQIALLAGIVVLTVVLVFLALLWHKNRQLRERNRSLYEKNRQVMKIEADEQNLRKAYSRSSLNDVQRESLVTRIQDVLDDAEAICQQDFTLNKLAKLINSNTTYVSQVINETYGMPFSNLLSSRRIKVACQWMDDPERYGNLTIEAIALGTGFKSRTTFINAFKRETGLKPSEFLRLAKTSS